MANGQGVMATVGAVLAALSTAVTIALTVLNAHWSREINATDQRLKEKAAELEEKRFELERLTTSLAENKDRIARFTFVQNLFGPILNEKDNGLQTLAVNMAYLALSQDEATKLFNNFQRSTDKRVQEIGNLGSDLVNVRNLVAQIDAESQQVRRAALDTLIQNSRSDPRAVDLVVSLLEMPRLESLSYNGRYNALYFLRRADQSAWTADLVKRTDNAILNIRSRQAKGVQVGDDTQKVMDELADILRKLRAP